MIDEVWDQLRSDSGLPAGIVRRRIVPDAGIDIFAAVEHPSGTPLLLVGLRSAAIPVSYSAPEAAGFSMTIAPAALGRVELEIRLLETEGEAVFRSFVDCVLEALSGAPSDEEAFDALSLAIQAWQDFFKKHGAQGLAPGAQQGLFGELWVLRDLIAGSLPVSTAVEMWVGPTGANQDFEKMGYALEVKTCTSNPLRSVRVHNLRQLDDSCIESLRLVLLESERHANGIQTLPWAVAQTRCMVRDSAPHMLSTLNALLLDAGYLDRDEHRYSGIAYSVRAIRGFNVSESFPRLVEATVPPGVGNVEYSISLEAAVPYEISIDSIRAELGALNGDLQ